MSDLFLCCDDCNGSIRIQTSFTITQRGKTFDVNRGEATQLILGLDTKGLLHLAASASA